MGDLIQKLPTDSIQLSSEEHQNFFMLFPPTEEEQPQPPPSPPQPAVYPPHQQYLPKEKNNNRTTQNLKKECTSVFLFILVFFLLNVPYVKQILVEYIPLCSNSWIITNLLQAIIFALVLWLIINSEYSRV